MFDRPHVNLPLIADNAVILNLRQKYFLMFGFAYQHKTIARSICKKHLLLLRELFMMLLIVQIVL